PAHNRNFVGRVDEMRRLREPLLCGRVGAITAMHGLGGIGKTALAFEYAHAFAAEYPGGRYLLPVEGVDDLREAFRKLEGPLGLTFSPEEQKDPDLLHARVRAELESRNGALLVLDNMDRPALLAEAHRVRYLPDAGKVHVLVTTRQEPEADAGLTPLALDR